MRCKEAKGGECEEGKGGGVTGRKAERRKQKQFQFTPILSEVGVIIRFEPAIQQRGHQRGSIAANNDYFYFSRIMI